MRGRIGDMEKVPVWLPWAVPTFAELCTRCLDCALACEERIIVQGDGGFPKVDFSRGECIFCEDCVDACKTGALNKQVDPPWTLKAKVDDRCLSMKGITCRSCGDTCVERAIKFRLQVGGKADLSIDSENCTGCGGCVGVCPVKAVSVSHESSTMPVSVEASAASGQQEEIA